MSRKYRLPAAASLVAALSILSLSVAAPLRASAQQQTSLAEQDAEMFGKFDADSDSSLSRAEVGVWPWGRYDKNNDGLVSRAEFLAGRMADRQEARTTTDDEKAWKLLDWTSDGNLSGIERDNGLWLKFDTDGDGRITRNEFVAGRARERAEGRLRSPAPARSSDDDDDVPATKPQPVKKPAAAAARRPAAKSAAAKSAPAPAPAPAPARAPARRAVAARPGHIVGSVARVGGGSLGKVTIEYGGFLEGKLANTFANGSLIENVSGKTDASDGTYAVKVPPGTYRVNGYSTFVFNGQTYHFPLELVATPRYDYERLKMQKLGSSGLVRNFALKLTGPKPGETEGREGYTETTYIYALYGGRVDLDARNFGEGVAGPLRDAYPPESRVLVTLTPVRLVDGSKGSVISIDLPLGDDGKWTFNRRGILPGTYTASARLRTPDGNELPLKISRTGQYSPQGLKWQETLTFTFAPSTVGPMPRMGVDAVTLYLGR